MSVAVLLLLAEIAVGRIKLLYLAWTAVATWATVGGGLVDHATFAGIAVQVWQLLIVAGAVYLAASSLLTVTKNESASELMTHPN